jgi:intracellular multiplication protein IcmO
MTHYGTDQKNEIDPQLLFRDTRPIIEQVFSFLLLPTPFLFLMVVVFGIMLALPFTLLILFPGSGALVLAFKVASGKNTLPFKMPKFASGILDQNEYTNPVTKKPSPPEGIFYLGNQRSDIFSGKDEELWLSNSDARMHFFVAGTTGAGKTESLLSGVFNGLCWGSGFIYVDGKADNSLVHKVHTMARRCGREDDLLILNFMQGGQDPFERKKSPARLSNTLNPMARGSGDFITNLITSMMPEVSGDGAQWRDKAVGMMEALIRALVYMRFKGEILIDPGTIREYVTLDKVIELGCRDDLPDTVKAQIMSYLDNLPGFRMSDYLKTGKIEGETKRQHDYLSGQFTKLLGTLNDTYGAIFKHQLPEIDMMDVVLNNRILVVLIPSLEKSKTESEGLGRLVVSTLRLMMAITLGSKLEGTYKEVVDSKLTNGPSPYQVVLDEAGYYFTEGTAKMFAQARSLGFSLTLSGQDKQAMAKGANKEEVESCIANTKIKQCMALEDPADTYDIFAKAAGEAIVTQSAGYSGNMGMMNANYYDMMNVSFEKRTRLTVQELRDLDMGQSVYLYKAKLIRANSFYVFGKLKINKKRIFSLNQFLKIPPPSVQDLRGLLKKPDRLSFSSTAAQEIFNECVTPEYEKADSRMGACIRKAIRDVEERSQASGEEVSPTEKSIFYYLRTKQLFKKEAGPIIDKRFIEQGVTEQPSEIEAGNETIDAGEIIDDHFDDLPFDGSPEVGIKTQGSGSHSKENGMNTEDDDDDYDDLPLGFDPFCEDDEEWGQPYDAEEEYKKLEEFSFKPGTIAGITKTMRTFGSKDPEGEANELMSTVARAIKYKEALPPEAFKSAEDIELLLKAIEDAMEKDGVVGGD